MNYRRRKTWDPGNNPDPHMVDGAMTGGTMPAPGTHYWREEGGGDLAKKPEVDRTGNAAWAQFAHDYQNYLDAYTDWSQGVVDSYKPKPKPKPSPKPTPNLGTQGYQGTLPGTSLKRGAQSPFFDRPGGSLPNNQAPSGVGWGGNESASSHPGMFDRPPGQRREQPKETGAERRKRLNREAYYASRGGKAAVRRKEAKHRNKWKKYLQKYGKNLARYGVTPQYRSGSGYGRGGWMRLV